MGNLFFNLFKATQRGKVQKMLKKHENNPELKKLRAEWVEAEKELEKSVKAYKRKNKGKKLPWEDGYKFEK